MEDDWTEFPFLAPEVGESVPETWIWGELNISSGNHIDLPLTVPNMITSWSASAFVLTEGLGLGLTSELAQLDILRAFFVSLNVPFSVTRGEEIILEVTLFNYLKQTLEITVTLELSDSFDLLFASNNTASNIPNQQEALVPSQSGRTVLFPVRPKQLGEINFNIISTSSIASEVTSKKVLIKAEGIHKFFSQTVLLEAADNSTQTVSKSLSFKFPSDVVNGSELAYVTVTGDILGLSMDGLDSLIQMPYGCGEQNMITFCPSVYVLKYLNATGQVMPETHEKAIKFMKDGYQRELTYLRDDGSFSAFGMGDSSGSTWLSAFVLKCFRQARPFFFVDDKVLENTAEWLLQHLDNKTGEFLEPGHVMHTELQGGKNGSVSLTAYILAAFLEETAYQNSYTVLSKTIEFLEQKFEEGISSNYTLAVVAYALSLANSTNASSALDQLIGRAKEADGSMFWPSPASGIFNHWQPRSSEIEIAAYALLACYQQNRTKEGRPIMKWLSKQRSPLGGYTSTQDTVLALQALSQFAASSHSRNTALTVSITGSDTFVPISLHITSNNLLELQSHRVDAVQPLSLNVTLDGKGIAVCQLNVLYNIKFTPQPRSTANTEAFVLNVEVEDTPNDLTRLAVRVCTSCIASTFGCPSGMALMEVRYLSGFTLDPSRPIQNDLIKKVEPQDGQVNIYFDSIAETIVCVLISMLREARVSSTQDATVFIMDYYKPSTKVTRLYSSEVMRAASPCAFCGDDCLLCRAAVNSTLAGGAESDLGNNINGPSNAASPMALHITPLIFFLALWCTWICHKYC